MLSLKSHTVYPNRFDIQFFRENPSGEAHSLHQRSDLTFIFSILVCDINFLLLYLISLFLLALLLGELLSTIFV